MNTDLLTFFSDKRSRGVIRIYDIGVPGNPDVQVLVYSPAEVNLSSGTAKGTLSDEEYKDLLKEIRSSLAPKGGMIAQIKSHNGVVQVAVTPVKAHGYTPPRKVLRLGPAALPKFEEIPQKPADLPVGDHLVVPVSTEAERRLQVFHEVLDGFPPDLALSVLNVIRRPSLEWRIERLEKQARQAPATWVGEQRSRVRRKTFLEKLGGWSLRRLPVGALSGALAVTFLLATGAVAGYRWLSGDPPKPEGISATTDGRGAAAAAMPAGASPGGTDPAGRPSVGSRGNEPRIPSETESKVSSPSNELIQALENSENAAIRTLYETHVRSSRGQILGWGMAKLEALRLGIVDPGNAVLTDSQEWTAVKSIYRSESGRKALESRKEASTLLAWTSCTFFGKPELPATQENTNPPFLFGTERDCRKLDSNDIRSGLEDLTNWVKAQTK